MRRIERHILNPVNTVAGGSKPRRRQPLDHTREGTSDAFPSRSQSSPRLGPEMLLPSCPAVQIALAYFPLQFRNRELERDGVVASFPYNQLLECSTRKQTGRFVSESVAPHATAQGNL
jgi:hypothetical protein